MEMDIEFRQGEIERVEDPDDRSNQCYDDEHLHSDSLASEE